MIEIVLEKSFFDEFGIVGSPYAKLLDRIFLVEKNLFILTKELHQYIEDHASEIQLLRWSCLFTSLSDSKQIRYAVNNTLDTDIVFNEEPKVHDFVIVLTKDKVDHKSCSLLDTSVVNKVFLDLLTNDSKAYFNYAMFSRDGDIKSIFDKLFYCTKSKNYRMIIISRYLRTCEIVELIKHHFKEKAYWTTRKTVTCVTNNLKGLKPILGNLLHLYAGKGTQIHERELIIGNMIIEFTDDFDKINTQYQTWGCSINIDKNHANSLRLKQSKLTRVY